MTPQTLRKERRRKFESILSMLGKLTQAEVEATAELLADAAASRTEVRGIEAAMFGNRTVTESDLPIGDEALKAFERDMQCPGSWQWYPAKPQDEPAWKALREFVISLYQSDNKAFEKYYTWARDPFARGAKLPIHIRQDPTCFEYAWQAFRAANPVVEINHTPAQLDENGIPETY
jgi:hypothetical protein